jgi:hypothetical protein
MNHHENIWLCKAGGQEGLLYCCILGRSFQILLSLESGTKSTGSFCRMDVKSAFVWYVKPLNDSWSGMIIAFTAGRAQWDVVVAIFSSRNCIMVFNPLQIPMDPYA